MTFAFLYLDLLPAMTFIYDVMSKLFFLVGVPAKLGG